MGILNKKRVTRLSILVRGGAFDCVNFSNGISGKEAILPPEVGY